MPTLPNIGLRRMTPVSSSIGPGSVLSGVRITILADGRLIPAMACSCLLPAGRISIGPSGERIYAAKLAPRKVVFGGGSFDLTPTITITTDAAGRQTVGINAEYGNRGRGMFGTPLTCFQLAMEWLEGGQRYSFTHETHVACLHPATAITLHDGQRVPIGGVVKGEYVRNPITGAAMRVTKIIYGPEPYPLAGIGSEHGEVWFSQAHPVPTGRGCLRAAEIQRGDLLLGEDAWRRVLEVRSLAPRPGQLVYNLAFDHDSEDPNDHLFLANGIVVGDYWLQGRLAAARQPAGRVLGAELLGTVSAQEPAGFRG